MKQVTFASCRGTAFSRIVGITALIVFATAQVAGYTGVQ